MGDRVGVEVVGEALVGGAVGVWDSSGRVGVLVVGLPVGEVVGLEVVGEPVVGDELLGLAVAGGAVGASDTNSSHSQLQFSRW